jgi:hypothetical protein
MQTWDDVVALAAGYPGVVTSVSHGRPALRVGRKILAAHRTNPDALVLKTTDVQEREALLDGRPEVFFTTPHYDGYPAVLTRLDRIEPSLLAELLEDAWRTHALKRHLAEFDARR